MIKDLWKIIALSLAGLLGIFVLVIVATAGAVLASQRGLVEEDLAVMTIFAVMALLMMALSLWLGVAWMQRIDEAAREAHKAAWFYGGSGGMAVGGVFVILASAPGAERLTLPAFLGRTDPAAYAACGAMAMLILMLIGYAVVWGWWWLARR